MTDDIQGIRGERIRLVPLDRDQHLPNYVRWFNDPEVTRYLSSDLPLSRAREEAFFDRAAQAEDMIVWAVLDEQGRHIGGTGLHGIDWRNRCASSGTVIGAKEVWRQGYGAEIMRVRTAWAFDELGLHRIDSACFAGNTGSARCLAKAGYRQVGLQRKKWWRRGEWHDCILWEILDEDFFAGRAGAP
jgi:RimJ/RimL family protein N-acetyltransferase